MVLIIQKKLIKLTQYFKMNGIMFAKVILRFCLAKEICNPQILYLEKNKKEPNLEQRCSLKSSEYTQSKYRSAQARTVNS